MRRIPPAPTTWLPSASPPFFLQSHRLSQAPDPTDILDLATKSRLIRGDDDTLLLVGNSTVASHSGRPPFDDPVYIYVPLLARPQIIHVCHADVSCHLGVIRTLSFLQRFYWWIGMEV